MDGTVYLGDNLIDGAVDAVKRMNERFRALFLTNNSSAAPSDYVLKLRKMGFEVKDDDVFTSGNATIEYLHAHYPNKRVFLFGNDKLFAQFAAGGINLDFRLRQTYQTLRPHSRRRALYNYSRRHKLSYGIRL